ncbi:hypothetical protein ACSHWB_21700 [Lentzea sp. HUAS TT2]|uniref:hypothetical protein n=1 Tax=Lentzea sp. HUAS TT2 TaxID=3447454 RepID=UPI003F6E4763
MTDDRRAGRRLPSELSDFSSEHPLSAQKKLYVLKINEVLRLRFSYATDFARWTLDQPDRPSWTYEQNFTQWIYPRLGAESRATKLPEWRLIDWVVKSAMPLGRYSRDDHTEKLWELADGWKTLEGERPPGYVGPHSDEPPLTRLDQARDRDTEIALLRNLVRPHLLPSNRHQLSLGRHHRPESLPNANELSKTMGQQHAQTDQQLQAELQALRRQNDDLVAQLDAMTKATELERSENAAGRAWIIAWLNVLRTRIPHGEFSEWVRVMHFGELPIANLHNVLRAPRPPVYGCVALWFSAYVRAFLLMRYPAGYSCVDSGGHLEDLVDNGTLPTHDGLKNLLAADAVLRTVVPPLLDEAFHEVQERTAAGLGAADTAIMPVIKEKNPMEVPSTISRDQDVFVQQALPSTAGDILDFSKKFNRAGSGDRTVCELITRLRALNRLSA